MKLNQRAQAALDNTSSSEVTQYKSKEEFFHSLGVADEQEIKGGKCIVKLRLPAQYLEKNASRDRKEAAAAYTKIAKELAERGHGAIVFPALTDQDGNHMFDIEVINVL